MPPEAPLSPSGTDFVPSDPAFLVFLAVVVVLAGLSILAIHLVRRRRARKRATPDVVFFRVNRDESITFTVANHKGEVSRQVHVNPRVHKY